MFYQAGPGIEPGPSALKASALPIELTWQTLKDRMTNEELRRLVGVEHITTFI